MAQKPTIAKKTVATKSVKKSASTIQPAQSSAALPELVHTVRRKEFVERVVARSGTKPNAIKSVLDAVLFEMGAVLSQGETLDLQPLGKIKVNRQKDVPNGEVLICKLRRKKPVPEIAD